MRLIHSLGLSLSLVATVGASEDWPQFRGPDGQGHSDATGLPQTWSETQNVKWKTAIPGEGWSSPVVLGSQVWLATALEDGKSLCAVCVDRDTGKLVHSVEVFHVAAPAPKHALNSHASPTPVIEQGRVYFFFGMYGAACLNTDTGKIIWKNTELKHDHGQNGPGSTPVLYGGLLFLNCDGTELRYVAALDTLTGKLVWKTPRSNQINKSPELRKAYATPLIINVNGRDQLISPGAFRVNAYEPGTGRELWFCDLPGFSNVPRPVFGHGLVYVCTGYMSSELFAIRPSGTGDISQTHVAWKTRKQVSFKPSPLLVGDQLYLVSDSGIASCLNAKTGEPIWSERLDGEYSASPIVADGAIYFFSQQGQTTVIKPDTKLNVVATNTLAAGFMASPAVAGKALFLRTKTHLYRLEK